MNVRRIQPSFQHAAILRGRSGLDLNREGGRPGCSGWRLADTRRMRSRESERGSVLVIVLLIAFGLISISLYFANSMWL